MAWVVILLPGQLLYNVPGNCSISHEIIQQYFEQLYIAWEITLECPGQLYYCPGNYSSMSWGNYIMLGQLLLNVLVNCTLAQVIIQQCLGQLYCLIIYSAMICAVVYWVGNHSGQL